MYNDAEAKKYSVSFCEAVSNVSIPYFVKE